MTEMLTLLFVLSAIIWFVIDRIKPFWAELSWGKYITIAVAAILGHSDLKMLQQRYAHKDTQSIRNLLDL